MVGQWAIVSADLIQEVTTAPGCCSIRTRPWQAAACMPFNSARDSSGGNFWRATIAENYRSFAKLPFLETCVSCFSPVSAIPTASADWDRMMAWGGRRRNKQVLQRPRNRAQSGFSSTCMSSFGYRLH